MSIYDVTGGPASFLTGLPELAINLVVAVVVLLFLSIISIFIPAIGLFIFGIFFLIAAFFFKDIYLDAEKNISIAAIMIILGIGIILFNLLAIGLHLYSVILSTTAMSVIGMSTIQSTEANTSIILMFIITVTSALAATLFVEKFSKRKKRRKK